MSHPPDARVALVGFGKAGAKIHAPLLAAAEGLRLTHVVTSSSARAEAAVKAFPHVRVVASVKDLWTHRDDLDTVVIAAPNAHHASICNESLRAGLPTVVDKPLARTVAEAAPLIDLAASSQVPLSVFHNRRWDTDFRTASRLISQGALGSVIRWESRFERWRPQSTAGWRDTSSPQEGGGLLLDLMTHLVDQALLVMGPARTVYAELSLIRPGVSAEDDVMIALEHYSGARSTLWASMLAAEPGPRLRVLGTRATYAKNGLDWQEEVLSSGSASRLTEPPPPREGGTLYDGDSATPVMPTDGSWLDFYAGWAQSLRDGAPPPVAAVDGLQVLRVTDAARVSAEERRLVRLDN